MVWKLCRWRDTDTKLGVILQQVLQLNTGCSIHYPRVAERVSEASSNPLLRSQVLRWGDDLVCTADVVASLMTELGHDPQWDVSCGPHELQADHFFRDALARLNKTVSLLQEAQELASNEELRKRLGELLYEVGCRFRELQVVQRSVPATTHSASI